MNEIETCDETVVSIDYRQCGVGSNICGPEPQEHYKLYLKEPTEYSFVMKPYNRQLGSMMTFGRIVPEVFRTIHSEPDNNLPEIYDVEFAAESAKKNETVVIKARTSIDTTSLQLYIENGKKYLQWGDAGNSVVVGDERIWDVSMRFGGAGHRAITFKPAKSGGNVIGVGMKAWIDIV